MADIVASVLARLRNKAKASGISYQQCLQLFVQEEFLRKLSKSGCEDTLILKGGLFIITEIQTFLEPVFDAIVNEKEWQNIWDTKVKGWRWGYDELTTQYDADLKRLNFIVDGEANLNASFSTHCPFCDGEVVVKKNQNYIDAAKSDYKKIKLQAKDLESASKELRSEKLSLEQEIGTLMAKKKSIEELIEKELKPQVFNLKEKLSTYKDAIECQKEIDILKKLSEQKTADMIENDTDEESELKFKVKEHLDYSFINELSNGIKSFLENCNYDNLLSVIFDKADMDIVINGKKKSSNGKGYNAYFNSVVAIVLSRYMESKAKYSPDFLVLDSPILSLKEKETKKPSETIRNTLFENIVDNQKGIQTIVIENEIPEINYKDANIIHFTKEKNNGRYGFLLDVAD